MNTESSPPKFYCITRDGQDVPDLRFKIVGSDLPNLPSHADAREILGTFIPTPRTKTSLLEFLQRNKETGLSYGLKIDDSIDPDNWTEYGEGCETQKIGTLELTLLRPQARKGQGSTVD